MQFSIGRVISFIILFLVFSLIFCGVVNFILVSTPEMSKLYEEVENQISNRVYDKKFLDAVIKEHNELRVQFFKKNAIYLIISFLACIFVPGYICFSGKKEPKFVFTQAPPYPPQNPYPPQYPPRY
ncbi:hypothetical protein [Candidatus Phytoplasma solani]|uniref:hypothetical protein n=1 Tax=Candidatus Phytoplasma solani TaxID=69896 RepID=UPI0003B7D95A|nr:hypothetical protein [Candidatus Phytoplasma solani]CCP88197.1 hypothetical protein S284_02600 [Candidatus Phytoplasma solani]